MSEADVKELEAHATELRERALDRPRAPREHGWLKGWVVPDDAFGPLTGEELKLWEEGHQNDPLRSMYRQ